jgi:hypothetical protein
MCDARPVENWPESQFMLKSSLAGTCEMGLLWTTYLIYLS